MKISRLLELHDKHSSAGLPENWGDGYLMTHNRVFRSIRNLAQNAGYKFTRQHHEAYDAFPLLQLESILESKALPYSNNVIAFQNLSPTQRDLMTWDDAEGNLKRNFVFHEGSHAVFRSLRPTTLNIDSSLQVVWMLLEESFANTMELLGVIDATEAAHRIFFEQNSYICEFDHRSNLAKALTEMSEKVLIPFMVLSYLHSNFLRERIEDKDFKSMFKILSFDPSDSQIKTLKALSKVVFNLSERFRYQTTDFHLRLAGVKAPYDLLQKTDFLKVCAEDSQVAKVLGKVAQLELR